MKLLETIFSIKNDSRCHKVITVLGLKFKIKNKYLVLKKNIEENKKTILNLTNQVEQYQNDLLSNLQGIMKIQRHRHDATYRNNISIEEHNENVKNLLANLSDEAKSNAKKIINRLDILYYKSTVLNTEVYSSEELKIVDELFKYRKLTKKIGTHYQNGKYKLPIDFFEPSVFYYRNGVIKIKDKNKINGKIILDVGCYVADSALVFRDEFPDSKIISFEPSVANYELALQTLELNHLDNIKIENIGLGDCDSICSITQSGGGSRILPYNKNNTVHMTTLDNYLQVNNITDIGLIKVDIEGFEQQFLKGAFNTIKTYRPTLLLSIYHSYDDFYKIKPMIESWNLGYTFDFFHGTLENTLEDEILLICESETTISAESNSSKY